MRVLRSGPILSDLVVLTTSRWEEFTLRASLTSLERGHGLSFNTRFLLLAPFWRNGQRADAVKMLRRL